MDTSNTGSSGLILDDLSIADLEGTLDIKECSCFEVNEEFNIDEIPPVNTEEELNDRCAFTSEDVADITAGGILALSDITFTEDGATVIKGNKENGVSVPSLEKEGDDV